MDIAGHSTTDWLKFSARLADEGLARTRKTVRRAVGKRRPVRILPYRGFGNGRTATISGRVLENREVGEPLIHDPWWRNLRNMYRHFASVVVTHRVVRACYAGQCLETATDDDGYFHFRFDATGEADTPHGWHPVEITVPEPERNGGAAKPGGPEQPVVSPQGVGLGAKAIGQILVPPADSEFGVVSDMDDTVIRSHVTDFWTIARLTFLKNAKTRKPFEGVAAFYRALHAGGDGTRHNPLFYVSSSAWNLYELFRVFLEHNEVPSGPILLRDMGIDEDKLVVERGHGHKLLKIERIFETYPRLRFVLIGDSGQDDPFIYREAVMKYPGRVKAIYIRDVVPKRHEEVRRVADEVTASGVPMLLVPDTVAAAEHAAGLGLIAPDSLAAIRSDRAADESPTSDRQPAV